MKTKNEVYVIVDTPKKAKKLKKTLDMFNEPIYEATKERLYKKEVSEEFPTISLSDREWCGNINKEVYNKTEVSIKELKNILAVEHLKGGDVVILKDQCDYSICEFERMAIYSFEGQFVSKKYCNLNGAELDLSGGIHEQFIRYATEEEKQLLNTKKELEVGKWYKVKNVTALFYLTEIEEKYRENKGFGIVNNNEWYDNRETEFHMGKAYDVDNFAEATPQEVEKALIEEAKRMYSVGDKLSKVSEDYSKGNRIFSLNLEHQNGLCDLWINDDDSTGYDSCIFKDGKWAEIIKTEPTIEEIEQKVVKYAKSVDCDPIWYKNTEYRIRPVQIGDWVSYNSGDIQKVTKVTEKNLKHYSKADCERIKDKELINKLNNL